MIYYEIFEDKEFYEEFWPLQFLEIKKEKKKLYEKSVTTYTFMQYCASSD